MRRRRARRLLWGLGGAIGAFAAVAAGWQAFGTVGRGQLVLAGVAAVAGGALAFYQAGPGVRPVSAPQRYPVPRQLPRDIEDFTGRQDELDQLERLLTKPKSSRVAGPIVAIAGKGGLGKTTLAVRAAQRASSGFADGQLFADLRGYEPAPADPSEVLGTFLRSLGAEPHAIPDGPAGREQLLRTMTADRRLLIVLDNANGPAQVRPLLPSGRDVAVIVTSRARLGSLEGAHTIQLDLLEPDEAVGLLRRIAGPGRVTGDPAGARRLVELCGYLPLAVRIVAAQLAERDDLTVAALARRLADERRRLDNLRMGDLDARSTFMISYRGLPPEQQLAFRLLGLFRGADFAGWALAALMDVPADEANRHLDGLVGAQLVDAIGPDETGTLRYRFHDLLRALAREQPQPEAGAAIGRLLGAYLGLAAAAEHRFHPGELHKAGTHPRYATEVAELLRDPVAWFLVELGNVVACVRLAHERELWEPAWELTHLAAPFFEVLAAWDAWAAANELALDATRRAGDRRAESIILFDTAAQLRDRGRLDDALAAYQASHAGYQAAGDPHGVAAALLGQGIIHRNRRDWDTAAQVLTAAADGLRATGERRLTAHALRHLAIVRRGQGEYEAAIALFRECLAEFAGLGDRRAEAYALRGLAQAELETRDHASAEQAFQRSLDLTIQLHDRRGEARARQGLGRVHAATGATSAALRRYAEAQRIADEVHDPVLTAELTKDIAAARTA